MTRGRRWIAALLAGIACLALVACSSPTSTMADTESMQANASKYANEGAALRESSSYDRAAPQSEPADAPPSEFERKIIRNAHMILEADDCQTAYDALLAHALSLGGYEASHDIQSNDKRTSVSATLKIPPDQLDEFLRFAGETCDIITSSTSSDDISESYYDAQTRLASKRAALERYYELLKQARTTDEIITIQRTIDGLTEDIEALEGRLRLYDAQVDMSTVNVSIHERDRAVQEVTWNALSGGDMGLLIRKGFVGTLNFFWSLLQWIVIVLATLSPVLAIAAVVLFLCRKRIRAWRQRRKDAAARYRMSLMPTAASGSAEAPKDARGAEAASDDGRAAAGEGADAANAEAPGGTLDA